MSAAPTITVGIPFHDEERHLASAVRSVLAQSFADLEVLLVDDGSRDRSLEIARSFTDPRVRVVSDGLRRWLPARLNEITAAARGRYVARMDADDLMHPDRLARELALLERGNDAVGTWAVMIDDAGNAFGTVLGARVPIDRATALRHGVFPHATMLARRELLLAHAYDETLTRAEDRDLFCRLVQAGARLAVVEAPLYVIRVSPRDGRFLPDYRVAHAQNRQIFRRYGPAAVGSVSTAKLVAASHAKVLVTGAAARLGLLDALVHRRGRPSTTAERVAVDEARRAAGET